MLLKHQIIYEAERPHRQKVILKYILKKWPHLEEEIISLQYNARMPYILRST
ncbi:1951_t:CDS:2 [Entrophospora sp. SA101]|nr:1951_t:CDS:2 [Entrophospora sp. SA101]